MNVRTILADFQGRPRNGGITARVAPLVQAVRADRWKRTEGLRLRASPGARVEILPDLPDNDDNRECME